MVLLEATQHLFIMMKGLLLSTLATLPALYHGEQLIFDCILRKCFTVNADSTNRDEHFFGARAGHYRHRRKWGVVAIGSS